jgi:tRNA A-37 threonylcarbamoyl transferase component Bud32
MIEVDPNDDERLCELLDRYVAAIQSGNLEGRAALVAEHPELTSWIGKLESLDKLAVERSTEHVDAGNRVSTSASLATMAWGDSDSSFQSAAIAAEVVGQLFGNYQLLEESGRGGMGVVYKARQCDLDRVVALKMILSSRLASEEEVRRFHQEARAAAGLRHPNIVGIHEVGQIHGQHYFTMDFVAGRSLARLAEAGPLDPDRAARLIATVARAVHYLHAHGIVHRDLKPSNILLDEHDEPLVTDFGLAKVFQDDTSKTQTGAILGTPSYMAPEQARGETAKISPRTDVYSLGAVLYELLTGRPPFREENQLNTILQVLEGEPTLPRRINSRLAPELERIVMRAMEKAPADRYASAAALADDLDRYLRHEPLETKPIGLQQRLRRFARRQPALVAHAAGILAIAAIVQVNYMINRPDPELYRRIMIVLAQWLALVVLFQWLLLRGRAALAPYAWATVDIVLLTFVLGVGHPPFGPTVVTYALIVVSSGLWFRLGLVWYTTVLSLAGYAFLLWNFPEEGSSATYPYIFVAVLALIGYITGYQLHRLQVLSRYFEQQRGR